MNKKISYYFVAAKNTGLGIKKKIHGTTAALLDLGYEVRTCEFCNQPSDLYQMIKELIFDDSSIIFMRYHVPWAPILFFVYCYLRVHGKKIIIDIPTPRSVVLREINKEKVNAVKRFIKKTILLLSGSWVLYPVNVVIQYAPESKWFEFGLRYKTLYTGNGIYIDANLPLAKENSNKKILNLIAVAQFAYWHGYDRLIKAIAQLTKEEQQRVKLTMVGYGDCLQEYIELVEKFGLEEQVIFLGKLSGSDLDEAFDGQDFGVASLGLFRIDLQVSSVLKVREYLARGLPVIAAGKDFDFTGAEPFRIQVSNDESIENITFVLKMLIYNADYFDRNELRKFSEEKLSILTKIRKINSFLSIE